MCPHSGCTQAVDIKSLEYNKVLDRQMKAQQITIATQASQHQPDVDIDDLYEDYFQYSFFFCRWCIQNFFKKTRDMGEKKFFFWSVSDGTGAGPSEQG